MNTARAATWEQIKQLSLAMAEMAERQEWDAVLKAETERRVAIGAFFDRPVSAEEAPEVAEAIQSLMAMDQAMMSGFEVAREETANKVGTMVRGKRMDAAYSSNT